jgi:hypothetical protein
MYNKKITSNNSSKYMNNNKTWAWILGAVILVVIIVVAVRMNKNDATDLPTDTDTSTNGDAPVEPTEDVTTGSVNTPVAGSASAALTYQKATELYGDRRIQFTPSCQADPNNQTWKNGTLVMLDNRSASTRSLHLGTMGDITIKPWGFKIVKFSSAMLPSIIQIDCDGKQNVAQINIQK